jgi:hypothetical protein
MSWPARPRLQGHEPKGDRPAGTQRRLDGGAERRPQGEGLDSKAFEGETPALKPTSSSSTARAPNLQRQPLILLRSGNRWLPQDAARIRRYAQTGKAYSVTTAAKAGTRKYPGEGSWMTRR